MKITSTLDTYRCCSSSDLVSIVENSPHRISVNESNNCISSSVTSKEVPRQIEAATDPPLRKLERLYDLKKN